MRLDSCWIWVCNNHPTTFLRYSAPPLDECKFATVIANSPTGGIGCVHPMWLGPHETDLPILHVLLDTQGLRAMSSTSPAWHFRRLVTMSHPKSIKTAKFTYCWLWILTRGPRCAPKCDDSKAVGLWIPWKNFDWKKKICFETTCQPTRTWLKEAHRTTFLYFRGVELQVKEKIAGEIRPCPKHESEVISTHPQYTIGNLNLYQTNWYGQVLSCKKIQSIELTFLLQYWVSSNHFRSEKAS